MSAMQFWCPPLGIQSAEAHSRQDSRVVIIRSYGNSIPDDKPWAQYLQTPEGSWPAVLPRFDPRAVVDENEGDIRRLKV